MYENEKRKGTLTVGWGVGSAVGEEVSNKGSATTVAASILAWSAGSVSAKSGIGGLVPSGVGEKVGVCVGFCVGFSEVGMEVGMGVGTGVGDFVPSSPFVRTTMMMMITIITVATQHITANGVFFDFFCFGSLTASLSPVPAFASGTTLEGGIASSR